MSDSTSNPATPKRSGPWLRLGGLVLVFAGVAGYVAQLQADVLTLPWYMPAAATIGAALVLASFVQRRTFVGGLALVLTVVVAACTWLYVTMTRLPPYAGPVAVGKPFPTFVTKKADGSPFSEKELPGEKASVFVFFRGRW